MTLEGSAMPVRVTIAGTTFETDSVAEAVEIHRMLNQGNAASPSSGTAASSPVYARGEIPFGSEVRPQEKKEVGFTPEKIRRFVNTLNENGKKIVDALVMHPNGLTTDEVSRFIHLDSVSLPPVMRHVRITAERAGLDADLVLRRTQITADNKPKSRYRLAEEVIDEMTSE
jgi:hypothetical protein